MASDLGTPYLRLERRGPLAWCIIDRPEARNALTAVMYFGIRRAVDLVNSDPDLHALILTGTGDVFCPGGDLRRDRSEDDGTMVELLGSDVLPFEAIRRSAAPVVSAINGLCQGGGLTIAMLSDVSVASERASFRGPELLRGIADTYYAQIMPMHVGIALTRSHVHGSAAKRHGGGPPRAHRTVLSPRGAGDDGRTSSARHPAVGARSTLSVQADRQRALRPGR